MSSLHHFIPLDKVFLRYCLHENGTERRTHRRKKRKMPLSTPEPQQTRMQPLIPAPGILWREAAGGHAPSGEPSVPGGHLYRGWPKRSPLRKPTREQTHLAPRVGTETINLVPGVRHPERGERARTFSSVGMVSLSLAIRLDTCSMPKLRNSSLPTTSVKCCSVSKYIK